MYLCKLNKYVKMEHGIDTEIQFSGLKPGTYSYKYTLTDSFFSEYKNEKILGGEVYFDVKLEKKERLLLFFFSFSGKVKTECDRCLSEMEWPVEGEQTLCVKFSDEEQSDDEEIAILPENAYKIDLAQWMYEYVAVQMPIRCVHADNENGQSTCDPNMLNYLTENDSSESDEEATDPRWDILKQLKD